jgi:hypothetical protein
VDSDVGVSEGSDMGLVDEVAAHIRAVIADLGQLRTQLDMARHDIERAGQAFAHIGQGTTVDQLPQAVAACAEAAERVVAATGVADQARELLWNYLVVITPGLAGPRPTAMPVAVSPATPHKQPEAAAAPYFGSFFDRLPVRRRDDSPTDGVLTAEDGTQIQAVASGKAGPGQGAPGLKPPWSQTISVTDHAEGHAAAQVRSLRLSRARLYLNNQPCPNRGGCDRLLPDVLPEGARLTVYGPDGFCKVYVGNGRGLA